MRHTNTPYPYRVGCGTILTVGMGVSRPAHPPRTGGQGPIPSDPPVRPFS